MGREEEYVGKTICDCAKPAVTSRMVWEWMEKETDGYREASTEVRMGNGIKK